MLYCSLKVVDEAQTGRLIAHGGFEELGSGGPLLGWAGVLVEGRERAVLGAGNGVQVESVDL